MNLESIVIAFMLAISLFLAIVAWTAFGRSRSKRMALVSLAFTAFLVKALFLAGHLFVDLVGPTFLIISIAALDGLALLLLYFGILKR